MARPKGALGEKLFADALRIVVKENTTDDDGKTVRKIRRIASKLVDAAMEGDVQAARDIRDTLDGKPRQQVDLDHSGGVTVKIPGKHSDL